MENLVKHDKGETDYEKVSELADRILEGTAKITRLDREEEHGRIAGGRRNVEASLYLAAKAGYDTVEQGNSTGTASKELTAKRQEESLKEYAVKAGIWYAPEKIEKEIKEKSIGENGGWESNVYFMEDHSVIKIISYNKSSSKTPAEFLDNRISLYNYLFKETGYELLGFTENSGNDPQKQGFQFIVRQKEIKGQVVQKHVRDAESYTDKINAKKQITDIIFKQLRDKLNLEPFRGSNMDYISRNYKIEDVRLENVMESENDNVLENPDTHLYYVDVSPQLNIYKSFGGIREYSDFTVTEITENKT
ncbi:MAG: hypothetical protein LBG80_17015 [Bacteroidales bacterium]|nr:hypothetical protein [Bacteroidales bacterium]